MVLISSGNLADHVLSTQEKVWPVRRVIRTSVNFKIAIKGLGLGVVGPLCRGPQTLEEMKSLGDM